MLIIFWKKGIFCRCGHKINKRGKSIERAKGETSVCFICCCLVLLFLLCVHIAEKIIVDFFALVFHSKTNIIRKKALLPTCLLAIPIHTSRYNIFWTQCVMKPKKINKCTCEPLHSKKEVQTRKNDSTLRVTIFGEEKENHTDFTWDHTRILCNLFLCIWYTCVYTKKVGLHYYIFWLETRHSTKT